MIFAYSEAECFRNQFTVVIGELAPAPEASDFTKYTHVRFRLSNPGDGGEFEISATKWGVRVIGKSPEWTTQEELDEFYKVMQWALRHQRSLAESGKPLNQDVLTEELSS